METIYNSLINVNSSLQKLRSLYNHQSREDLSAITKKFSVWGRVMAIRRMGKTTFLELYQQTKIQIFANVKLLDESVDCLAKINRGDIVVVCGTIMKTKTNELSIRATRIEIVVKTNIVFPEKFHGLKDVEIRYRNRHLDLLLNHSVADVFIKRSQIISEIRRFLDQEKFIEVETPILQKVASGAIARPFVTYYNSLKEDFYLRIAPELFLKKLIIGGMDRVYEIGKSFRNEGIDSTHNPEFTTLELYQSNANFITMMNICERLIIHLYEKIVPDQTLKTRDNQKIIIKKPFKRISMVDAINEVVNLNVKDMTCQEIIQVLAKKNINFDIKNPTYGNLVNFLFETFVEPALISPTFIYHYPVEISPLARILENDKRFTERFELFIGGREIANAFSELNDYSEQMERFINQKKSQNKELNENTLMDESFIEALKCGLVPTGGLGIGIDRLVMILTNQYTINDVILFPHLKTVKKA